MPNEINMSHMEWEKTIKDYQAYLMLEKGLANNTVEAYTRDILKLAAFCQGQNPPVPPEEVDRELLMKFLANPDMGRISSRSQARLHSGIKAFYKYLVLDDQLKANPARNLESPHVENYFPNVLSVEEVERVIEATDRLPRDRQRNRAIVETLYSCGLRISELVSLQLRDINLQEDFVRVHGKGNKERIVPIGSHAHEAIDTYIKEERSLIAKAKGCENILFLRRNGKPLSRVRVYNIIQELATVAGISKHISPHTFRHSFATHLVNGGADLRVVQDLLGHESITTTEIYAHIDSAYLRDTIVNYHPRSKKKDK